MFQTNKLLLIDFSNNLLKFRSLFPEYTNHKIISAIGGLGIDIDAIDEAKKNGMGIIKIIGEKVEIYTENLKIF